MIKDNNHKLTESIFALKRAMFTHLYQSKSFSPERLIQYETLSFIDEQKKTCMKDLARLFGITPPSVTCMIDKLETQKSLIREHDQQNRRNVYLRLTATGKNFLKKTRPQMAKLMIDFLKPLTDKDKEALITIYQKIFNYYEDKYYAICKHS